MANESKMSNTVLTLDEELDREQELQELKFARKKGSKAKSEKGLDKFNMRDNASRLTGHSNDVLYIYTKRTPQYRILTQQFDLLKTELLLYKKAGDDAKVQQTQTILDNIATERFKIKDLLKNRSFAKPADGISELYRDSPELKEFDNEKKELEKRIKELTPSTYTGKIKVFRDQLKLRDKVINKNDVVNFDDIFSNQIVKEAPVDLSKLSPEERMLHQEYIDFCGVIGDIVGLKPSEIKALPTASIGKLLAEKLDVGLKATCKDRVEEIKAAIALEKDKISGKVTLTDFMFETFDIKQEEGSHITKEILAAAYIPMVKATAGRITRSLNALNKMDDAISYGLVGLNDAINKWHEIQLAASGPISFQGFASNFISKAINTGLLELAGNGATSGTNLATISFRMKQKLNDFVKYNPEFAEFNRDALMNLINNVEKTNMPLDIVTETDYKAIVSSGWGDGGDNFDVWSSASNMSETNMGERKIEYERLLSSIKGILNLFENQTKPASKNELKNIVEKKLFDKYDHKLFMMQFGFDYKREKIDDSKIRETQNNYTQLEMAIELEAMYALDGIKKTFSQPAIVARIKVIISKIKAAIESNPKLKEGFEYFYSYWLASHDASEDLKYLSGKREELGMKFDRDELREAYAEDTATLATQLSDGRKLSDIFEITENNPLDEEIIKGFTGFFDE